MGSRCDGTGVCQWDRDCPFYAENCRKTELRDSQATGDAGDGA